MRILILGGAGFLGKALAKMLMKQASIQINDQNERKIDQLVLVDIIKSNIPDDDIVQSIAADISQPTILEELLNQPFDLIFHLAAIVSGEAEKDFDKGMRVNLHATMQLLECCRQQQECPTVVFASSCAVFGGDLTQKITDSTAARPQSSYGTQKAMADLLINDYSRRGFIDGRVLRLPTIAVRPGKPNAATSSFVSGIIREPLNGEPANCPVSPETMVWILSPNAVIHNFMHAATLSSTKLGINRIINLPGLRVSIADMVQALEVIAGKNSTDLIQWNADPFIQSIVLTWPTDFITTQAEALGFIKDDSVEGLIQQYVMTKNSSFLI